MAACCSHDHDCAGEGCGESSLHRFINHAGVRCLNAKDSDAAARVLRPWHERAAPGGAVLESEDDPELIVHVPFTSDVKARRASKATCWCSCALRRRAPAVSPAQLRGLVVSGTGDGYSPTAVRAFVNRDVRTPRKQPRASRRAAARVLSAPCRRVARRRRTWTLRSRTSWRPRRSGRWRRTREASWSTPRGRRASPASARSRSSSPQTAGRTARACASSACAGRRVRAREQARERGGFAPRRRPGADTTCPCAQGSGFAREGPKTIVYEAKPQPQDHKVPGSEGAFHLLQ